MIIKAIPMRDALLESIWQKMSANEKIFFTTADFGSPILDKIRSDFPKRFVNVGIAEQNLINVSAGLALEGFIVFAYAIAPFITMRCYEQIRVNLALLSQVRPMNVNLIGVGAGFSYVVSGPTHQCYEDITLMRAMPNIRVLSPSDHVTSAAMLHICMNNIGPKYLRLDAQILPVIYEDAGEAISKGFLVQQSGKDICLITTGYMLHTAFKIVKELEVEGYSVGLIDIVDLSSFDQAAFLNEIKSNSLLVSMEEGFKARGGLDSLLFSLLSSYQSSAKLLNIGVEDGYRFELGTRTELHEQVGIGPQIALEKIKAFLDCHLKRNK